MLDGTFTLEDLGSTNGTFVNGRPVVGETPVSRDDVITLGLTVPMPWPDTSAEVVPPDPDSPRVLQVGRDPGNDIVVDSPEVSAHHARVVVRAPDDGLSAVVEDLGSTNGKPSVNVLSPKRSTHAKFTPTDVVYLGPIPVPASKFFLTQPARRADAEPVLYFQGDLMTVGRDPSCDLVIDVPVVSSRHARLHPRNREARCRRPCLLERHVCQRP